MDVVIKAAYSCKLVEDLEKERRSKISQTLNSLGIRLSIADAKELMDYTLAEAVRKYCQMGVKRRWQDFFNEMKRNVHLDDAGRQGEMTMPELMLDQDKWSDEDRMVYEALKKAKIQKLGGSMAVMTTSKGESNVGA